MTSSDDSDIIEGTYLLAIVFGAFFSALIMGIEAAVGGAVAAATEFLPAISSVALVFTHAWLSDREVESGQEVSEPSEI